MKSLMDLDHAAFVVLDDMAYYDASPVSAFVDGAAVAFGLMGMAEAIREHEASRCGWCGGAWRHVETCKLLSCAMPNCDERKRDGSAFCSDACQLVAFNALKRAGV